MDHNGRNTRHNGRAGIYNAVQSAFAPSLDITLANGLWSLFTYTRATTATVKDFEGLIKTCLSGELRIQGARRVQNRVGTSSENASGSGWARSGTTVTTPTVTWVDGSSRTVSLVDEGTATSAHNIQNNGTTVGTAAGCVISCYVKMGSGAIPYMELDGGGAAVTVGFAIASDGTVTLNGDDRGTPTWKGVENCGNGIYRVCYYSSTATANTPYLNFKGAAGVGAGAFSYTGTNRTVYMLGMMVEQISGQANTNVSEYVSVGVLSSPYHGYFVDGVKYFAYENGNTVASGVVTEAQGAAITGTIGYLAEGARTNLQKQNRTLTTAPWTNQGTPAATQNATGIDGATTAWTLTDNDAGAIEYIYCGAAELALSGSTQYTYSIFVGKQGSAPSGYPCISVDNGTYLAGCTIDPYNGTATVWTAYTGFTVLTSSATCSSWNSNFWRVELTFTTHSSMTNGTVAIIPAGRTSANSATGTNDVAATGVTVFDAPQIEAGAFASSPIITTTAAVARNADQLTCPSAGILNFAQGAAFVKATGGGNASGRYIDLFSTYPLARSGAGGVNLTFNDGTNNETVGTLSSGAFSTPSKMMTAWGGGASAGCVDGGSVTTGLFDGALAGATLYIGGAATVETYAVIEQVKLYLTKPSAAQMQAMTS